MVGYCVYFSRQLRVQIQVVPRPILIRDTQGGLQIYTEPMYAYPSFSVNQGTVSPGS